MSEPTLIAFDWRRAALAVSVVAAALHVGGCTNGARGVSADTTELAACAELVLPTRIKIQPWTRSVSSAGDGKIDELEVLLAAYDFLGDETKAVGTLHLELHGRRRASADQLENRAAFWSIELTSRETLERHWDRSLRFYRFLLRLTEQPLEPGRYVLSARLLVPSRPHLFDEHEFTIEPAPASPSASP